MHTILKLHHALMHYRRYLDGFAVAVTVIMLALNIFSDDVMFWLGMVALSTLLFALDITGRMHRYLESKFTAKRSEQR